MLRRSRSIATVIILALLLACGEIPREKLVKIAGFGLQLAAQLEANETVPQSLFDQGVITHDRLVFLTEHIVTAKRLIKNFNDGMTEALKEEQPSVRALVSLTADLVAEVQTIARDASPEWKKALAIIEVSLRAIASYFAAHVSSLRKQGFTDDVLARHVDLRAVRAIEEYAGR